jgi:hypothetical protein
MPNTEGDGALRLSIAAPSTIDHRYAIWRKELKFPLF